MNVKHIDSGKIYTAVKIGDNTYKIAGKEVSKEDFKSKFEVVAEQPRPKAKEPEDDSIEISSSNETMSESIANISKALVKATGSMTNGVKSKEGYNYSYMELGSLIEIVRPILLKNGLTVMQTHQLIKGKTPCVATHTTLLHESGEWFKSTLEIPLSNSKTLSLPQQVGVICTYSRRYTIQSLFMIASEDDNDGKV
jgi:hypothetical protein